VDDIQHLLAGGQAEPSDDTPTIITRPANAPHPTPHAPRSTPDDPFPIGLHGRRLAHFELLDPIGVGGMAAVIRARDTQLDRNVALKILPPEMAVDPENVLRFHQEARAAAKLDHENIARVFFCGEDQGLHFIAFEFVEGDNLRTILDRRGRIPASEALHYILQVATGLAHSAARGVVHRDIKPSNIIISSNGRAKLVDMGLARSQEPHGDDGLTQSGVTLGTFDYISPEQALEPRDADVRSDIYSLGCTFYHMLTGRAPVPEGTAAKKLHHHQHVAPIDPRQLDPEIPDEVAAILARMMAKDPRHRYQRAEHLVQHLIQLAHKLGSVPEVPEGVLYVDTPLPNPPRMRPLLVAVAGGLILIIVVVLHVTAPWSSPQPQTGAWNSGPGADAPETNPGSIPAHPGAEAEPIEPAPLKPPEPRTASASVETVKELAEQLKQKHPSAEVLLTSDLDLTLEGRESNSRSLPGLVIQGRKLVIRPKDSNEIRTITLKYDPEVPDDGQDGSRVWTALTVKGGDVKLQRLRFLINATQAQVLMAAIRVQDGATLSMEDCQFVQVDPPRAQPLATDPSRLSSLVVDNAHVMLERCFFVTQERAGKLLAMSPLDNQDAVTLDEDGSVKLTNCAFGPHTVLCRLQKRSRQKVAMYHCSSFVVDGTVFQAEDGALGRLTVHDSVFSCPRSPENSVASTTLIQQTGDARDIHFEGSGNRYHNLSAFWIKSAPLETTALARDWGDFRQLIEANGGRDQKALVLSRSPWAEMNPLKLLPDRPELAFKVDVKQPEMRQANNQGVIGVEQCTWGPTYTGDLPPLEKTEPAAVAFKTVDPTVKQSGAGIYPKLSLAIGDAKPGDEIRIKASGLVPVEPVKLEKATDDITLKPYEGYQPILTLGDTSDPEAALFRVHDGKLRIEGLQFHLRPSREEFTAQAVVDLVGDGQCYFKECLVSLEPRGKPLAVVLLTDPGRVMKMEPAAPQQVPRVQLERCFIRGQGDLMAVRSNRPLDLSLDNSLVALAGSFLTVEGRAKDVPAPAPLLVKLNHVTAYLTEHLVRLRADKDGKEPVPVQVNPATNCLFASAEGKSLIHLDGLEVPQGQMKHLFTWENGKQNAYSKFQPMLDQQANGEMSLPPYDQLLWKSFTGEVDGHFSGVVRFVDPPVNDAPLARTLPAQFKVKAEADQGFGAEVEVLPRPFSDIANSPAPPAP
jgi:serine/threonine protein kinase